jgi:hypothetical protein
MVRRISKVLLLVALLTGFVVSSVPAFGDSACYCVNNLRKGQRGGCQFDKKSSQCINTGCDGLCFGPF